MKYQEIEKAKQLLEDNGFYCGNLWRLEDVQAKFNCTDDEAYKVLEGALNNDATMEQIWLAIEIHGEDMDLEVKEDEDITKELALTSAYIVRQDLLNGTFFQTYDKAWEIAKEFVEKYPPKTKWGENGIEWDETVEEFTKQLIKI